MDENIYEIDNNMLEITSARLCYCIWRKTQIKWRLLVKCCDVFLGETEAIVAKWRSQLLVVRQTCASLHHGSQRFNNCSNVFNVTLHHLIKTIYRIHSCSTFSQLLLTQTVQQTQ